MFGVFQLFSQMFLLSHALEKIGDIALSQLLEVMSSKQLPPRSKAGCQRSDPIQLIWYCKCIDVLICFR